MPTSPPGASSRGHLKIEPRRLDSCDVDRSTKPDLPDGPGFWLAMAGVFVALGVGGMTIAVTEYHPPWTSAWFIAGAALAALGCVCAIWSLILFLAQQAAEDKDRQAVEQLKQHLGGRTRALPLLGEPGAGALVLGVHEAIPIGRAGDTIATSASTAHVLPWNRLNWRSRQSKTISNQLNPDLPTFVHRDIGPRVHEWLQNARQTGGFLLLIGDSSVGKTRLLYEAAREVLPDFAVLAPDPGDGGLVNKVAEAAFPLPRLIVWLDELQRFLEGPYLDRQTGDNPISATAVRQFLISPTPVVILGSMWREHAALLRAVEPDTATGIQQHRYPRAADVLSSRRVHEETVASFSADEREAAARLSVNDPRLAKALADRSYNVTEVLAGAPELDRRYNQATEEQRAVLNAAIDARRLGVQALLTEQLLQAAARSYFVTVHADDSWFPPALAELTRHDRPNDCATSPLVPVLSSDRCNVVGFTVADYLLQRLTHERRIQRPSALSWAAFSKNVHDHDDVMRLGDSAEKRLLFDIAEPLYRKLADAGDKSALGYLLNRSGIGSCSWSSPVLHGRFAAGRSRLGG